MDEDMTELGRRAVACEGFHWMPGMLAVPPTDGMGALPLRLTDTVGVAGFRLWFPDLTDPATLGCLLAMVREAWGDPGMFVRPRGSKMRPDWAVFTGANSDIVCASLSEAEALVAALEAASCR